MKLQLTGIAMAVAFAFATAAQAQPTADRAKCDNLKANAKDICMAEAKGNEKIAKAERKLKEARAEATYDVAAQKCDDQKGEAKDACIQQAKVVRDRAKGKAEKAADLQKENRTEAKRRDEPRSAAGSTAPEKPRKQ